MTDWYPLGAVSYRKWNVYDMGWSEKDDEELKLENYIVSGAQYGGPIARILDKRKCTLPADQKLMLKICTSAGKDLCELSWIDEVIVGMGWSDQEHLIIVMENGLQKNRLRGCSATENCYSSSSSAAEKYLSPWTYGFKNIPIEDAWKELNIAVEKED